MERLILMIVNLLKTIASSQSSKVEDVYKAPALAPLVSKEKGHRKLEGLTLAFSVLTFLALIVGGAVEIIPAIFSSHFIEKNPELKPYTPLQLAGRDLYIREGCYTCHSQQVRPMVHETLRFGEVSKASDFVYDHPFQWGSRRIGPDLSHVGGKYPDMWHFRHMHDPREVTPNSIMPTYTWLAQQKYDGDILSKKLSVMKTLGVPYTDEEIKNAKELANEEAQKIAASLKDSGVGDDVADKEIVALISYLQRLGKNGGKQ